MLVRDVKAEVRFHGSGTGHVVHGANERTAYPVYLYCYREGMGGPSMINTVVFTTVIIDS